MTMLSEVPASFPIGKRWYVFYTRIHAEGLARESISDLGFEAFVPFEKRIQRVPNRKRREYMAPLFPRYGFVRFDINGDEWGSVSSARGVLDLVRVNGLPRSVPESVINGLHVAESMGLLDRTKPPKVGMDVEVTHGVFNGIVGKVLRARAKDRVDVLLNFLGRELTATVNLNQLREVYA